jgi:hypothetical protein
MWPTIRDGFKAFFNDKTYFVSAWDKWVAKVRGGIMAAGASVVVYGDQIEASVPPAFQNKVKLGGILLMAFSLMLRAGEKNKPGAPTGTP